MLINRIRARRGFAAALACAVVVGLSGCAKDAPKLLPVEGKVIVGNQPLEVGTDRRRGYVNLYPDASRGNTSLDLPVATIDTAGHYKILTGKKAGAAPGWYKVAVSAEFQPDPNNAYRFERLVVERYWKAETSKLEFEVVEAPAPDAYDLKVDAK
jgi:hypothetical protein